MKPLKLFIATLLPIFFYQTGYSQSLQELNSRINLQEKISEYNDKYKIKNDSPQKEILFGAVPSATAILGKREVIPNLNILGSNQSKTSNKKMDMLTELHFFIAPDSKQDKNFNNIADLFVPEASNFGFCFNWTGGVKKPNLDDPSSFGFNASLNYLGKNLQPDSHSNFTVGLFHGKIGIQKTILKNMLSVYGNFNTLAITDNLDSFNNKYTNHYMPSPYFDLGAKMYLATQSTKDLNLFVDLDFIIVNGYVKAIVNNSDKVIPNIKIGLRKDFQF
jgi:hypothetical protein